MVIQKLFGRTVFFVAPLALSVAFKPAPAEAQISPFWYFTTTPDTISAQMPLGTEVCKRDHSSGTLTFNNGFVSSWQETGNAQETRVFLTKESATITNQFVIDDRKVPPINLDISLILADNTKKEITDAPYKVDTVMFTNQLMLSCAELLMNHDLYQLHQELKPSTAQRRTPRINFDMLATG